ncbi:MAG: GntR family transcriptional regulator [Rhodospirillales bacterium]|nr:GntR family transcriptional regulator [Rhodospirillales bacterium]
MAPRSPSGQPRAPEAAAIGFRPLYRQVRERLLRRLAEGAWPAGGMLPSEPALAAELGVSPGTVRKALDALAAENLLVRRQGRGTFVARHDERRILFQFFRLVSDRGERQFPESEVLALTRAGANAREQARLGLAASARVFRIRRLRTLGGRACIAESIALPEALFPGLSERTLPNNLYGLYAEEYGISIARASERLKAVILPPGDATLLGVGPGTPALAIDRLAIAIDGRRVEWRLSRCLTRHLHYASELV